MDTLKKMFLDEVVKKTSSKILVNLYEEYLDKFETSESILYSLSTRLESDVNKYLDIVNSSHIIFSKSQDMADEIACKDLTPYKERALDIIVSLSFYSGAYQILSNNIKDKTLVDKLIDIYEDANFKLNVPRKEDEVRIIYDARRRFYLDMVIPCKIYDLECPIKEEEYIISYLICKDKEDEIPSVLFDECNWNNKRGMDFVNYLSDKKTPEGSIQKELFEYSLSR